MKIKKNRNVFQFRIPPVKLPLMDMATADYSSHNIFCKRAILFLLDIFEQDVSLDDLVRHKENIISTIKDRS